MTVTNTVFCEKTLTAQLRRAEKFAGVSLIDVPCGVKSEDNEDLCSLREFTLYALKGIVAYMVHADALDKRDESLDDFLFYALRMTVRCRDINKMYELLLQTEGKNIDIYTHSEMLAAHAYPLFKKFPHLYGNYGSAWHRQNVEIASFRGLILMTSNCITPVQDEYRNRLFTTGCCHYQGLHHIEERGKGEMKDFSPLIELAQSCPPPLQIDDTELETGFAHSQLME